MGGDVSLPGVRLEGIPGGRRATDQQWCAFSLHFRSNGERTGLCELAWPIYANRAIYRLEQGRLLICSGARPTDPRPRTFAVTAQSDLFILKPAPGK